MLDVNPPRSTATATTRANSNSRATTQATLREDESSSESSLPEETNSPSTPEVREESSSREVEGRSRYYPGETTLEEKATQSRSQVAPRVAPRVDSITKEDVAEIVGVAVGEAMKKFMESLNPEVKPVEATPQTVQLPIEDVQLSGEKVNYRIAHNPEIFFRYSVSKARALGPTWIQSSLSPLENCTSAEDH